MQKLMVFFASILLLSACHSNQGTADLRLNNGEKWEVNAEMTPHIQQANQILSDYVAQNGTDYKKLAADLKAQNDQLIKSCTMKGESHDELHKWLHPHMGLVEKLDEAADAREAQAVVAQLEQSFKIYQQYFK
ncbi:MAG: hypothetical protein IT261_07120 [Saprospiraceae bacterium]|nr:hypothetical protein [Saprospiraceae bacterium]